MIKIQNGKQTALFTVCLSECRRRTL